MNINYKQTQFELFPGASSNPQNTHRPKFLLSSITLNLENIIVLTVLLFMAIIVSFSVGVERGKKIVFAKDSLTESKIAPEEKVFPSSQKLVADKEPIVIAKKEEVKKRPETALKVFNSISSDFYTVQVASFKSRKHAEKEALKLKSKGYEIFIVPKGKYMIVCAGKFGQSDQAKDFSAELKNKYKDCLVRRL